jgi:hypothetical protein
VLEPKLRRALSLAAFGLVLLALAAAAAWLAQTHASPDAFRAQLERRLAESLGAPVSVGPVSFGFGRDGVELTASDLRAFPAERGEAVRADLVEVQIDIWAALLGEVRLRGLDLTRPFVRLRREGDAFVLDAPPRTPAAAGEPAAATPPTDAPWHASLTDRIPRLEIADGTILLTGAGTGERDVSLEHVDAAIERQWLRGGVGIEARGEVRAGEESGGTFELAGTSGTGDAFTLELDDVALSPLAAVAGGRARELAPRGRASGRIELRTGADGTRRVQVSLAAPRLHLEPKVAGERKPIDPTQVRIEAHANGRAEDFTLAGELALGALGVPFEIEAGADGIDRIRLRSVDLAALGALTAALPEPERSRAQNALENVRGGRLDELELAFASAKPRGASRLAAKWRVTDAAIDVGTASRLTGLSGAGSYDGDVLELRLTNALLDSQPLPTLDLRLGGLAHVPALRCTEPKPASALPGRKPLVDWANGDDDGPKGPPSWRRLHVTAQWIEHPALLCAVEGLRGALTPDLESGGVTVSLERATWAGVPIRGTAHYRVLPQEEAVLAIHVEPPAGAPPPSAHEGGWARGTFAFETTSLGDWKTRGAAGAFRAEGARLLLDDTSLALDPGPTLTGRVDLDLSQTDRVPYTAEAQVSEGRLEDLFASAGWSDSATGSLVGTAHLSGALRPGAAVLGESRGAFSIHARDGVVRQRFRLLLAVAMASETLNPFRERGTIRYDAMDADGRLEDGAFVIDAFSIDGPALRAAAHGTIRATGAHETELVMGLYFFRTIDDVLGRVPIVNRIMLGKDSNLIGAYVAMNGPWEHLDAKVIPMKTLMKGPVGFVFEGLPGYVRESLRRVQIMLPTAVAAEPRAKEDS